MTPEMRVLRRGIRARIGERFSTAVRGLVLSGLALTGATVLLAAPLTLGTVMFFGALFFLQGIPDPQLPVIVLGIGSVATLIPLTFGGLWAQRWTARLTRHLAEK